MTLGVSAEWWTVQVPLIVFRLLAPCSSTRWSTRPQLSMLANCQFVKGRSGNEPIMSTTIHTYRLSSNNKKKIRWNCLRNCTLMVVIGGQWAATISAEQSLSAPGQAVLLPCCTCCGWPADIKGICFVLLPSAILFDSSTFSPQKREEACLQWQNCIQYRLANKLYSDK